MKKSLSAAVLLLAPYTFANRVLVDRSVVTINNDVILESDIKKFEEQVKSKSFQELFGGLDPAHLKTRDQVLQVLIEEKLIDQQVKKLDLTASDQEIDGQMRAILKRNGITKGQLTERLKMLGTTMPEYRIAIKRQIERRNLVEREIRPNMEVTEEQLRHYFARHAKPDDRETQFQIAHILVEHKASSGMTAEQRAKKIADELSKSPEQFANFAKDYSDDSSTSETGGDLGFFSIGSLSKEFREVVPKTPVGQITAPIKTKQGYHIIKVLKMTSADFATLPKERKEMIRNQMIGEELEKRMAMWLERKKNEAFIKRTAQ